MRFPKLISIETVYGCNARCKFCSVYKWNRAPGIMPDEIFETVIGQLKGWAKKYCTQTALMLSGEPLLDHKLESRLARCKDAGLNNVGFTTNASLLNFDRTDSVIKSDPDYVVFSFDTLDKEKYESNRKPLNFEQVLENILYFIKRRNETGSNIRIVLRHIDLDGNKAQFNNYRRYFEKLLKENLDEVGCTIVHSAGIGDPNKDHGITTCPAPFNRLAIQNDGRIPMCPQDFNTIYDLGNVMEQHMLEIFNNDRFNEIRKIHSDNKRNTLKICNACDIPVLNKRKLLYEKYTPSGKLFFANVYHGFDMNKEREKINK